MEQEIAEELRTIEEESLREKHQRELLLHYPEYLGFILSGSEE